MGPGARIMEVIKEMHLKLELCVLPVSDVDRSRAFYEKAGFRQHVLAPLTGAVRY